MIDVAALKNTPCPCCQSELGLPPWKVTLSGSVVHTHCTEPRRDFTEAEETLWLSLWGVLPKFPYNIHCARILLAIWGDRSPKGQTQDVHTGHCCAQHGCKYGDDSCPVVSGKKLQSYVCEDCTRDYDVLSKW